MSNINELTAKLKAAAHKATRGPWVETCGEVTTADYEIEGVTFLDHICNCEIIGTESPNAEFIAAVNPATVLSLIEALEAAEKRNAEMDSELEREREKSRRMASHIAELEARTLTVKLPPHKYRECVNGLLEEAIAYAGTQQLRERLSSRLANFVQPDHPHTRFDTTGIKLQIEGE